MKLPLLSLLIFTPLAGAVLTLVFRREDSGRRIAWGSMALVFIFFLDVLSRLSPDGTVQLVERVPLAPSMGFEYHLGIDGLGLIGVALATLLFPLALAAPLPGRDRLFYPLVLFLQAATFGVFTAQNFFPFFLAWELSLIPAFFLVRQFGGSTAREASLNFFLQTMMGSVAMLAGFAALYAITGTFSFSELAAHRTTLLGSPLGIWAFIGILLGFAVKVPLFGLHTWLPSTYASAPPAVTLLLTGVLSKMGLYGFLRVLLPAFPSYLDSTLLNGLALATVLYSSLAALAQSDLRRVLAWSSMAHLGFALLATFAAAHPLPGAALHRSAALNGVMLQIASHGLISAGLFFCVAILENRSNGLRELGLFGGLRSASPILCALMGILLFASLGLPGLSGFVAELLMMQGILGSNLWLGLASAPALLFTALFTVRIFQMVFYGAIQPRLEGWRDLRPGEIAALAPIVALSLVLGLCPGVLTWFTNPGTLKWLEGMR